MAQVAQIKEVIVTDNQIARINIQINAVDGKVPVKLFGLLNEFLGSDYLTVYPVSSKKGIDSFLTKLNGAMSHLEQMES